ncbi:MAG: nucleotidyltransferase domain-containing protein [Phycisphaerae bacterium]
MSQQHLPLWREALDAFLRELRRLYGVRLSRVVLYGSRARGDASEGSDIDVLVVLDPLEDFWDELSRIGPVASRISLDYDVVLSAVPVDAAELADPKTPLLLNSVREGVVLK